MGVSALEAGAGRDGQLWCPANHGAAVGNEWTNEWMNEWMDVGEQSDELT